MKHAFSECSIRVFITVDCCHGAEVVKKKKKTKLLTVQLWRNSNWLPSCLGRSDAASGFAREREPRDFHLQFSAPSIYIDWDTMSENKWPCSDTSPLISLPSYPGNPGHLYYYTKDHITHPNTISTPEHIIGGAGRSFLCKCGLTD